MGWRFPVPAYPGAGHGRGAMRRPMARSAPIWMYYQQSDQIPISGAQGQVTMAGNPVKGQVSVGPTGLGTIWYPASVVVSTSRGSADTSTCNIYIGPSGQPTLLQGSIQSGNGVLGLAIPSMSPGLSIIAVWTGGIVGTTCYLNVTGTMQALVRSA